MMTFIQILKTVFSCHCVVPPQDDEPIHENEEEPAPPPAPIMIFDKASAQQQLKACLASIDQDTDEKSVYNEGAGLVWTKDRVWLTVMSVPWLSVNTWVRNTPLWEAYMDDRERAGLTYSEQFLLR